MSIFKPSAPFQFDPVLDKPIGDTAAVRAEGSEKKITKPRKSVETILEQIRRDKQRAQSGIREAAAGSFFAGEQGADDGSRERAARQGLSAEKRQEQEVGGAFDKLASETEAKGFGKAREFKQKATLFTPEAQGQIAGIQTAAAAGNARARAAAKGGIFTRAAQGIIPGIVNTVKGIGGLFS